MSLEHAQRLVTTYIATGETTLSPELLDLVNGGAGSLGLLGLVKALGEYLTSVEDEPRLRALALLSAVIAQSPKERINRQSTRVLTEFYIDKLSDVLLLTPALQGLLSLSSLPTFGSSETLALVPALLKINVRALTQAVRFLIFKTLDTLMHLHRPALLRLGPAGFVKPYCTQIAEGEKDPRNLLLAFSLAKVIILEFDIESSIEELFDVTYCYFPITYRPPPRDPYGISTDDLRAALRACLAGSALFARQAMPLLLDKLSGSGGEMKIDTLRTIEACLPVFGRDNAQAYQAELWEGLKVEVLYTSSDEAEAAALQTLTVFLRVLAGEGATALESEFFDGVVLGELEQTLREPEKNLASQAVKMLGVCFAASKGLGRKTYSKVIPQLLAQFHTASPTTTQKQALLTSLASLVRSAADLYAAPPPTDGTAARTVADDAVLLELKDQLLGCLTAGLDVEEGRQQAMEGLMGLLPWLDKDEGSYVVSKIGALLSADDVGDDIREHALNNLAEIAKTSPASIENQILPALFASLPDKAPALGEDDLRLAYRRTLACLGVLCVQPTLADILVVRVLARLALLSGPAGAQEEAVYAFALLSTVEKVLRKKADEKHADLPKYADQLLPHLFSFFAQSAAQGAGGVAVEPRLIVVGGKIVELVVQSLSAERQSKFAAKLHAAFVDGKLEEITLEPARARVGAQPFAPLAADAPASQRNLLVLYSSGVIALRPDVELPLEDLSAFLGDALQWSLATSTTFLQLKSMFHLYASLVNKHCDRLQPFLEHTIPAFWTAEVTNRQASRERRSRSIRAWVWLCRALLVRNHELGFTFLSQLLDLLAAEDDAPLVLDAAKALAIIAEGDGDGVLTKRNHAVIRLLHKQKFFNFVIPKIEAGHAASKGTDRAVVYLVVLASIIPALPRALCVSSLPTLLPFLLKSLDLPDPDLKANVIQMLEQVAQVDEAVSHDAIESQGVTIVEGLLRSLDVAGSNERSRTAALRTLAVLPDAVRYDILHPVKTAVLKQLGRALDDKRRSVRKEAVDCRARWYLYHG